MIRMTLHCSKISLACREDRKELRLLKNLNSIKINKYILKHAFYIELRKAESAGNSEYSLRGHSLGTG